MPHIPQASTKAVFDGVRWCDVEDYYWAPLITLASEFTMATMGVGSVHGRLVAFAGH